MMRRSAVGAAVVAFLGLLVLAPARGALAADAGQVKTSRGAAWIERAGTRTPARIGDAIRESDVIVTGADGAVGITLADDSRLSIGPSSVLAIDRFVFDSTTHRGNFDSSLRTGTLAGVSGKLVRQSPGAMTVKTPTAVLGVRGTQFLVRTAE